MENVRIIDLKVDDIVQFQAPFKGITAEQDRAEFSINQYVYGVIMDVTDGRGIQTFDEICEELVS